MSSRSSKYGVNELKLNSGELRSQRAAVRSNVSMCWRIFPDLSAQTLMVCHTHPVFLFVLPHLLNETFIAERVLLCDSFSSADLKSVFFLSHLTWNKLKPELHKNQ